MKLVFQGNLFHRETGFAEKLVSQRNWGNWFGRKTGETGFAGKLGKLVSQGDWGSWSHRGTGETGFAGKLGKLVSQ